MTVYGEFLFIENVISGAVILLITGRIMGKKIKRWLTAAGSIMCGAYSFVLLVPLSWYVSLAGKLVFSMLVVYVVFRPENAVSAVKTAGAFYIVSFLTGGVTIALMYMTGIQGMTANGSIYLHGITYFQAASGLAASYLLGRWLADMLRSKIKKEAVIRTAVIHIDGRTWTLRALLDTGNCLRAPVTGYPVAVLSRSQGEIIKEELQEQLDKRICIIPYKSVGGRGLLYGFRPDMLTVGELQIEKVIIGISEGDFGPWNGTDKYEILLHQQLLEGEENYG